MTSQRRFNSWPSPNPPRLFVSICGVKIDTTPFRFECNRRGFVSRAYDKPVLVLVMNSMAMSACVRPILRRLLFREWASPHFAFRNGNLVRPATVNLVGRQLAFSSAHFASLASPPGDACRLAKVEWFALLCKAILWMSASDLDETQNVDALASLSPPLAG